VVNKIKDKRKIKEKGERRINFKTGNEPFFGGAGVQNQKGS
jgi:hypothetical protein